MDGEQTKIHENPFSKEGLGQRMIDMGVTIAKLSTDMEWVKGRLNEIIKILEKNDKDMREAVRMYQEDVDARFKHLETRVEDLESFRDKVKGATVVISLTLTSGVIVWLLTRVFG